MWVARSQAATTVQQSLADECRDYLREARGYKDPVILLAAREAPDRVTCLFHISLLDGRRGARTMFAEGEAEQVIVETGFLVEPTAAKA